MRPVRIGQRGPRRRRSAWAGRGTTLCAATTRPAFAPRRLPGMLVLLHSGADRCGDLSKLRLICDHGRRDEMTSAAATPGWRVVARRWGFAAFMALAPSTVPVGRLDPASPPALMLVVGDPVVSLADFASRTSAAR
jgi:hypothetical protein